MMSVVPFLLPKNTSRPRVALQSRRSSHSRFVHTRSVRAELWRPAAIGYFSARISRRIFFSPRGPSVHSAPTAAYYSTLTALSAAEHATDFVDRTHFTGPPPRPIDELSTRTPRSTPFVTNSAPAKSVVCSTNTRNNVALSSAARRSSSSLHFPPLCRVRTTWTSVTRPLFLRALYI